MFKGFGVSIMTLMLPLAAAALSTETLPQSIRTAQIKYGNVAGIDQVYGPDRKLYDLGAKHSIPFDAQTLARVNAEAQTLVQALNAFGSGALGSKINLGTLKIDTRPVVQYTAPVFGYGISDNWTVGVGAPFIRYTNKISLSAENSNLDFYRSQFSGLSTQLDRALNIDLASEAQRALASKGYRALGDRDESYLGDVQVAIMHKFMTGWKDVEALHQMKFILPTGPAYDADDLMAPNIFGRTSFDNTLTLTKPLAGRWNTHLAGTLKLPIPDTVVMRVPKDEDDNLPDESQKQGVRRQIGMSRVLDADLEYVASTALSLSFGGEYAEKDADRYTGTGRTDLLSINTDANAWRSLLTATYSTVAAFKRNEFPIPGMVTCELSDTFAGKNIERQTKFDLTMAMFF